MDSTKSWIVGSTIASAFWSSHIKRANPFKDKKVKIQNVKIARLRNFVRNMFRGNLNYQLTKCKGIELWLLGFLRTPGEWILPTPRDILLELIYIFLPPILIGFGIWMTDLLDHGRSLVNLPLWPPEVLDNLIHAIQASSSEAISSSPAVL